MDWSLDFIQRLVVSSSKASQYDLTRTFSALKIIIIKSKVVTAHLHPINIENNEKDRKEGLSLQSSTNTPQV